jgi:iron only hydrogenase large subunit-like protein
VTSAETVLLESQSGQEVMIKLREASGAGPGSATAPIIVVSLAPQSVAALAGEYVGIHRLVISHPPFLKSL